MSLKKTNFEALNNYNVNGEDLNDLEDGLYGQLQSLLLAQFVPGCFKNLKISAGAGLSISVPTNLCLFATGKIAPMVTTLVNIDAADVTNPRYDRVEAEFTELDGRVGVNEAGDDVVITKDIEVTLFVNKGTPDPTPTVPALTANRISLGVVLVQAGATSLTSADVLNDERYFDLAKPLNSEPKIVIANNTTTQLDVLLDGQTFKNIDIRYDLFRKTDESSCSQTGTLNLNYNPSTDTWKVTNPFFGDDCGVEFSRNGNGYLEVSADEITGAAYLGEMQIIDIKKVKR